MLCTVKLERRVHIHPVSRTRKNGATMFTESFTAPTHTAVYLAPGFHQNSRPFFLAGHTRSLTDPRHLPWEKNYSLRLLSWR